MADLKAAAKWLRETAGNYLTEQEREHNEIAAQALEAWAWQQETGALTKRWGKSWRCCYYDGAGELVRFDADTPLGAVLEAMEGERDA